MQPHGYSLKIIGPYENISGEYNQDYIEACLSYRCSGIIDFLGLVNQSEVKDLLSKSLYLIHFSEKEGMPNVVLEALASRVYPIVGPMGGLANELIDDGVSGFIIKDEEFERSCLVDDDNNQGYNQCVDRFSFEVVASKTVEIYDLICQREKAIH